MSISWSDDLGVTEDPDRFDAAVRAFRKLVPMTDEEFDKLTAEEQTRAFTVANVAQADLVQEVFDALADAVENGGTLEDFKEQAGEQLGEAWGGEDSPRLEMVFRTNVMGAYGAGADEILSSPEAKEARPYCRQDGIEDDRLCPICEPLVGVVLPADDSYWDSHVAPFHPQCRCPPRTPLTEEEAHEAGVDEEPPSAQAVPGFGTPARDWEPDASDYDDAIAAELEHKLAG